MLEIEKEVNQNLWKRVILRCAILLFSGWFLLFAAPGLLRLLLPFLIALLVARLLHPLVESLHRTFKIPRKAAAVIFDILIFLILFSLLALLLSYLLEQAVALITAIQENWGQVANGAQQGKEFFAGLIQSLPAEVLEIFQGVQNSLVSALQSAGKAVLESAVSIMTAVTTHTGNFFINLLMAVIAAYYMASDYSGLISKLKTYIGVGACRYLNVVKRSVFSVFGAYVKSMFLLAAFAFVFMLTALLICRQPYAMLIALLLALIDFLPLIGTIAILIPWGAVAIMGGDMNKGIYLIAVGIVFYLIRQVVSPKIVGTQTGLHPLVALVSMYVGLKVSGVLGAIFGPLVLMLILSIAKSGIFDSTVADFTLAAKRIASIFASA